MMLIKNENSLIKCADALSEYIHDIHTLNMKFIEMKEDLRQNLDSSEKEKYNKGFVFKYNKIIDMLHDLDIELTSQKIGKKYEGFQYIEEM